ncbi:MAG: hypothetical protein V4724_21725 [Pseudomonadota bacterium]
MHLSEFIKAPNGMYSFNFWIHPISIPSVLGVFSVELRPDTGEPDFRMVDEAKTLALFMRTHPEELQDKVYEHYKRLTAYPDWLTECSVPGNLEKNEMMPYLEVRNIVIIREDSIQTLNSCFYISPQWDVEHAIYLKIDGVKLEYCEP